jgi:hypothetical protein
MPAALPVARVGTLGHRDNAIVTVTLKPLNAQAATQGIATGPRAGDNVKRAVQLTPDCGM